MLRALTTPISSRLDVGRACMWHIEVATCHIEEGCMNETFIQHSKGVFESDKYRQQVRLAVLVAQTRGAVWSGVRASL